MNNMKRFSVGIIVLWMAASCLAQSPSGFPVAPPGGSDGQVQAKDLEGKRGKLQVDEFTGSFGYSIPIACAPARNGSEPALALVYSSKGENGWCGVGWKLDIGYIERNTQNGIPVPFSATSHLPLKQYDDSKDFILNLFGQELKLLPTATNGTLLEFDAEVNTDFLRCILDTSNNKWQVYDKSGNVYYFGQTGGSRVVNPKTGWSSGYNATFQWALDQIVTATGDWTTIAYTTSASPDTGQQERIIYPTQITYNGHTNYNGYSTSVAGTHTISFGMEARPDWRFSYRWGFRTEQNRRLTNIVCQAGGQQVWHYALSYGTSMATKRSLLKSVTVYGSDDSTPLPVQTFTYQGNPNGVSFGPTVQWGGFTPVASGVETFISEQWSGYTVADLVDIDGDGLPDWVVYDSSTSPNRYLVQKNLGKPGASSFGQRYAFGPSSTVGNPIPDGSYFSTLNSQHVRLRDINGDGLPDRVCDWWACPYNNTPNTYTNFEVMMNVSTGFTATASMWPVSDGPAAAGNDLYLYQCVESGGVNSGFFDINGDGLPDRVMSRYYSQGPMTNFVVQFNTGSGFTTTNVFGPYNSQNWNTNTSSYYWAGLETPYVHMVDLNGDGLPDRVMLPINPSSPINPVANTARTNFAVEWNDGYSFESTNTYAGIGGAADVWPGVNPQISGNADYAEIQFLPYVGLYDLNGDGLPDRVMLNDTNYGTTPKSWLVYLNNGHGFDTTAIVVTNIESQGQSADPGWWGPQSSYIDGSVAVTLMDINGDGLLDRVMTVYGNSGSTYFLVQTNTGPFPDLLTTVNNGIGGTMAVVYLPSTVWDNRKDPTVANSGSTLPFPQYTVATITESDGINPPRTNSYSYAGGFYDGSRREFSGFAVVTNTDATLRTTVTYFHTGGGRNYSTLGEYQDAGNFAKRSMAYRVETYGNDNNLYKFVVNQVDQTNFNNGTRFFPFVSQSFEFDYPGPRITGTRFVYDTTVGNLTNKTVWGEVTNVNLNGINTPTDVNTADNQYYQYSYASIGYSTPGGSFYITDHTGTNSLTADSAGTTVIQQTQYTYNSGGTIATKLVRISPGYFATSGYGGYNSYGLVTLETNPVGVVTEITYESTYNTYPATTRIRINPGADGGSDLVTTTSYDARSGLATSVTDPMGVNVANTYDAFYRLTESDKIPVGGSAIWMKKVGYNLGVISAGSAASYIAETNNDGVGGVESRTYLDGFGRPVQTRTQGEAGNYRVVSTAYDGRGNAFLTTWPIFGSSAFSKPSNNQMASWIGFDAAGRVATNRPVSVTFDSTTGAFSSKTDSGGDAGSSPLGARTWSYVNGSDPWWIICTDEDGKTRRYGLDAFGRTNQIQEVDGANIYTTTLKYDLANNLTNIVNANTQSIYYAYNDAGGLVAMADPHLGQWTYVRDYAGRLRVQTDARGDVVSNSYVNASGQQDPLGRLQVQTVFGTNYTNHVLVPAYTNIYTYDSSDDGNFTVYPGLLYKVTDGEGWEKTGYDSRTRVIKTARHLNINNQTYTNSYTFDDGNNVTSVAYPNSGPTITNAYFTGGSIKQVANSASFSGNNYYTVSAANIDEFGHVTSFAYGNSLTTTRSYYSTSKRLLTISAGSGGSVFSRTYTYTTNDDIASINGTGVTNVSVTYDNLHRIKSFTGTSGLSGNYGYDAVGNITNNIEGGGSSYSYANPRKQAVRTAFGYTNLYDLCGNMIVRHGGLTNSQAMLYDADNRLKIFSQAGKVVVEYGYAADGARLWKRTDQSATNVQVWIGNTYEEKGGKVLFHVFAGGQQVCTFETNSALFGGSDMNRVAYYYHEDNLNSSSALSDSSHNQIEVDAYYPFGRALTANPQASFQVSRRFTGQVFDGETGLYYYNARYYDPELGRFIQPDTEIPDLSNPQSYNRYSYVLNNPLRYTDPNGHDPTLSLGVANLTVEQRIIVSRAAAPAAIGVGVAMATAGVATPLLVSAGASTTFAAVGSGMIAGATGDLAAQGTQIGLGQRQSISGQEVAVSSLAGGALNGVASKIASLGGASEPTPAGTPQGQNLKYHYTTSPESSFENGLRAQSSVTDNPNLTARQAVEQLGVKTPPNKVIPIQDQGNFVPNKPAVVQEHFNGPGGGKDFTNPQRVPPSQILPAKPVKPEN
jgi:RHS repeat-associated protein